MATHAIGANQHERLDGIARSLLDRSGGDFDTLGWGGGSHLVADVLLDLLPIGTECRNEIAMRGRRPIGPLPGGTAGVLDDVPLGVLETGKKQLPLRIDGLRVRLVARI